MRRTHLEQGHSAHYSLQNSHINHSPQSRTSTIPGSRVQWCANRGPQSRWWIKRIQRRRWRLTQVHSPGKSWTSWSLCEGTQSTILREFHLYMITYKAGLLTDRISKQGLTQIQVCQDRWWAQLGLWSTKSEIRGQNIEHLGSMKVTKCQDQAGDN